MVTMQRHRISNVKKCTQDALGKIKFRGCMHTEQDIKSLVFVERTEEKPKWLQAEQ